MIKMTGRRLFSRALMGVPMALKTTAPRAVSLPDTAYASAPAPMSIGPSNAIASRVWKALNEGSKDHNKRSSRRYMARAMMGGLDPDLAVLNSMSVSRRVALQCDREQAEQDQSRTIRHRIVTMLGGNPEDYEY